MSTFRKLPLHFKALQAYTGLYSAFAVNYHSLTVALPYHFVTSRRRPWISGREVVGMSYNSMQDILFQNSIIFKAEWILCWGMDCSRLGTGIWISGWYCSLCKLAPAAPNSELLHGRRYWYSPFVCTNECLSLSIFLWPLCHEKYSTCWPLERWLPKE